MFRSQVSAATQQNATETNKTQAATPFTIPQGVKKIIGVGLQIITAGLTTLEDTSCILELESSDSSTQWAGTQQFCIGQISTALTSGTAYVPMQLVPTDIAVTPGAHITPGVTFNTALTVQPSWRCQLVYE